MVSTRLIAFSGPKFSGKDTAAKALFAMNRTRPDGLTEISNPYKYFKRNPFAGTYDPPTGMKGFMKIFFGFTEEQVEGSLKEVVTEQWPNVEPRWPMMDLANWLRDKYGGDCHVKSLEKRIDHSYWANVVTDHRFPEELDWLKANNALIIYIERGEAANNLAAAQASGNAMALNPSEMHFARIKKAADYVVNNDGPAYKMQNEVVQIVRKHFGYWGAVA